MDLSTITVSDFKAQFKREFQYAPENSSLEQDLNSTYIFDSDITRAFAEAQMIFNEALFGDDASIKLAYLYLTAHYLVLDLRNAANGGNGGANFPIQSKNVGSVSVSYAVPEQFKNNAQLMGYTSTGFGNKYLSFLLPNLVGNVVTVIGATTP